MRTILLQTPKFFLAVNALNTTSDPSWQVDSVRQRFVQGSLMGSVLRTMLTVQGLVVQKTKLTTDCEGMLTALMDGIVQVWVIFV